MEPSSVEAGEASAGRCRRCGSFNPYPTRASRLTYRKCFACLRDLRSPGDLLGALPALPEGPTRITPIAAEYAAFHDPSQSIDCSERIAARIASTGFRFLSVSPAEDANILGGGDPAPGIPKVLRVCVRVRDREIVKEVRVTVQESASRLQEPLLISAAEWTPSMHEILEPSIEVPKVEDEVDGKEEMEAGLGGENGMLVVAATIGHPRRPDASEDVTELVRGVIQPSEEVGGLVELSIPSGVDLRAWLPDPCPGRPKMLRIRYMIRGRQCLCERWILPGDGAWARFLAASSGASTDIPVPPGQEGRTLDPTQPPFYLIRPLRIVVPKFAPALWISGATWGHPASASASLDVSLVMQSRCFESPTPGQHPDEGALHRVSSQLDDDWDPSAFRTRHLEASFFQSATQPGTPRMALVTKALIPSHFRVQRARSLSSSSLHTGSKFGGVADALEEGGEGEEEGELVEEEMKGGGGEGRMDGSMEATEKALSWAELASREAPLGEWLLVPADEDLHEWFGDPYKTAGKSLMVWWKMSRRPKEQRLYLRFGKTSDRVRISGPIVEPSLAVTRASFEHAKRPEPALNITLLLRRRLDDVGKGRKLVLPTDMHIDTVLRGFTTIDKLSKEIEDEGGEVKVEGEESEGESGEKKGVEGKGSKEEELKKKRMERFYGTKSRRVSPDRRALARFGAKEFQKLRKLERSGDEGAAITRLAGKSGGQATHTLRVSFAGHGIGGDLSAQVDTSTGLLLDPIAIRAGPSPAPLPFISRAELVSERVVGTGYAAPTPPGLPSDFLVVGGTDGAIRSIGQRPPKVKEVSTPSISSPTATSPTAASSSPTHSPSVSKHWAKVRESVLGIRTVAEADGTMVGLGGADFAKERGSGDEGKEPGSVWARGGGGKHEISGCVNVAEALRRAMSVTTHGMILDIPAGAPLEGHLHSDAIRGRRADFPSAPGEHMKLRILWETPESNGVLHLPGNTPGPIGADIRIGWAPDSEVLRFVALKAALTASNML